MKENFTAIAVIIDASGSMYDLTDDTIGNFNAFLNEQKAVPGEAVFSLCTFNTNYKLVHDFCPLNSVGELTKQTYSATGGTALLDAMGATIDFLGTKLAAMPEEDRPSKVIVLVITDGRENQSRQFNLEQIKNKVTHQQEKYNWQFVFIGANIDAIHAGTSMGFSAQNSVGYVPSSVGTQQLYRSVSVNLSSLRSSVPLNKNDFFGQTGITPTSDLNGTDQVNSVATAAPVVTFDPGHSFPTTFKK